MHVWSKEKESSDTKIRNRNPSSENVLIHQFIYFHFLWEDTDNYPKVLQPVKKTEMLVFIYETIFLCNEVTHHFSAFHTVGSVLQDERSSLVQQSF